MADFNPFAFDYRAKFDAGAEYTVVDPWKRPMTHGGEPVTVRLAGENSARFKNAVRQLRRENADKVLDDDDREQVAIAIVSACTVSWENVVGADGKPLSLDDAKLFWTQVWPYNGEQASAFIRDESRFLGLAPND